MNAVDRAKKNHQKSELQFTTEEEKHFEDGYYQALEDVQAELGKEVSLDYEAEIKRLKEKHECEIKELTRKHEYEDAEADAFLQSAKQELEIYKAKWDVVELIFGGK